MQLNSFKNFLSTRTATLLIICFALAGRLIQLIFYYNLRVDTAYQAIATSNFVNGHGLSVNEVFANDLSNIVYSPLIKWPPGYSVILAPFYVLFNHNYILAAITLNIVAAFTLFFTLRAILKKLRVPIYLVNLFSLVNGFFIYPFYFIASSDGIAITAFVLAIYFSLVLFEKTDFHTGHFIAFVLLLFLAAFIKYLFIPVVFVIPALLLIKGGNDKNRVLKTYGLLSGFTLLISIGAVLLYQKSIAGSAVYVSSTGRGFFPGHIKESYPFTTASFIKPETAANFFDGDPSAGSLFYTGFQIFHCLLLLGTSFLIIRSLKHHRKVPMSLVHIFFNVAFFLSLATYGVLLLLSLTVEKEVSLEGTYLWTYVQEARYYGLPVLLVQTAFFVLFFSHGGKRPVRLLLTILAAFLFVECARGFVVDVNRVAKWGKEEYSWQYEDRFQKYADSLIRGIGKKNPGTPIVLGSPAYYMNLRVSLYSGLPVLNGFDNLKALNEQRTKKEVILLMIVNMKAKAPNHSFFAAADSAVGKFDSYTFYTVHVPPHPF